MPARSARIRLLAIGLVVAGLGALGWFVVLPAAAIHNGFMVKASDELPDRIHFEGRDYARGRHKVCLHDARRQEVEEVGDVTVLFGRDNPILGDPSVTPPLTEICGRASGRLSRDIHALPRAHAGVDRRALGRLELARAGPPLLRLGLAVLRRCGCHQLLEEMV